MGLLEVPVQIVAVLLILFSLNAHAVDPKSFDILLTGRTPDGPHVNEDAAIRKLIAGTVQSLQVKKYFLRPTPVNGGFRVCIELVENGGYEYIVGELSAVAVRESIFEINLVERCR